MNISTSPQQSNGSKDCTNTSPSVAPERTESTFFSRWQTLDSPCFPLPICSAVPPRRPERRESLSAMSSHEQQQEEPKQSCDQSTSSRVSPSVPQTPAIPTPSENKKLKRSMKPPAPPRRQLSNANNKESPEEEECQMKVVKDAPLLAAIIEECKDLNKLSPLIPRRRLSLEESCLFHDGSWILNLARHLPRTPDL